MATIDISARIIGARELAQSFARISTHDIPKAIKAGVRDAARAGKTRLAKEVGSVTPVSAARLKADLKVTISPDRQTAQIAASSKPMSAMQFKPRQTRAGLNLTLYKGEKTLIRSGFMQSTRKAPGRGKLPFKPAPGRAYSGDRRRNTPRQGMDFVQGLSLASIYLGGKHSAKLQAAVEARVSEALENGIIRSLGGMARGYGRA